MKIEIAAVLVCLLVVPLAVQAEQWEMLYRHELGEMSLDMDSVRPADSGLVTFWGKRRYDTGQRSLKDGFTYDEQRVHHELDCAKHTITFIGMQFLNDGKVVSVSGPMRLGPRAIEPGGFLTKAADRLCAQMARKTTG